MQAAERTMPIVGAARDFLASKRIAVTGVSTKPARHGSNVVYQRLSARGHEVFAVSDERLVAHAHRRVSRQG